jgi:hypothetical protein
VSRIQALGFSLALASFSAPAAASAATIRWPADRPFFPCGELTLGECIEFVAQPGDVVEVQTNDPIFEDLLIQKSLILRARAGFAPVLGPVHGIDLLNTGAGATTITVQDFTLEQGRVRAIQISPAAFNVTMRNLTALNALNNEPILELRAASPGPFVFEISGNHLTIPLDSQSPGATAIWVEAYDTQSTTGVIRDNRIDHFDGGQQGAIFLYNGGDARRRAPLGLECAFRTRWYRNDRMPATHGSRFREGPRICSSIRPRRTPQPSGLRIAPRSRTWRTSGWTFRTRPLSV